MAFHSNIISDNFMCKVVGYNQIFLYPNLQQECVILFCEKWDKIAQDWFKFAFEFTRQTDKRPLVNWARMTITADCRDHKMSHKANQEMLINVNLAESTISNKVFTVSGSKPDHDDNVWLVQDYKLILHNFTPTSEIKMRRQVWLFTGMPTSGKSYLNSFLNIGGMVCYETDTADELPDEITANVIVVSSKYKIQDIVARIPDKVDVIPVIFGLPYENVGGGIQITF